MFESTSQYLEGLPRHKSVNISAACVADLDVLALASNTIKPAQKVEPRIFVEVKACVFGFGSFEAQL